MRTVRIEAAGLTLSVPTSARLVSKAIAPWVAALEALPEDRAHVTAYRAAMEDVEVGACASVLRLASPGEGCDVVDRFAGGGYASHVEPLRAAALDLLEWFEAHGVYMGDVTGAVAEVNIASQRVTPPAALLSEARGKSTGTTMLSSSST